MEVVSDGSNGGAYHSEIANRIRRRSERLGGGEGMRPAIRAQRARSVSQRRPSRTSGGGDSSSSGGGGVLSNALHAVVAPSFHLSRMGALQHEVRQVGAPT